MHQNNSYIYRPQRSWGKVMFLHMSVILFTGGVCPIACWDTPPREQTAPLGPGTPQRSACWEIRATSGQYASYWNAFLLVINSTSYWPQRSCGQGNIFTPVCHSVHRGGFCLSARWDTTPPHPGADTPPGPDPPGADTPREADSSIRSTSGRYASYWNAFLLSTVNKLFVVDVMHVCTSVCAWNLRGVADKQYVQIPEDNFLASLCSACLFPIKFHLK